MTCIKTGADVWLSGHECTVHGDLFQVGETFILCMSDVWKLCTNYAPTRWNIRVSGEWEECGSRCIAFTAEQCSDFFYNGYPLSNEGVQ